MNLLKILNHRFLEKNFNFYILIFLSGMIARSFIALNYGDKVLENEWKILVYNLYNFNSFSMLKFDDFFVPNLWMPPIYGYFIYLHALIFGIEEKLVISVIISQIIISSLTTLVFFNIVTFFFKREISILGSIIFCFFPIIVFSSSQISSVTIYLFLFLLFIFFLLKLTKNKSNLLILSIGIISGILVLTRRDFILIYFFSLIYFFLFFKVNWKKILLTTLVLAITISPYLIRNYIAFDKIILHSGFGFNVWKAYNPKAKVEGYYIEEEELISKIENVKKDVNYRINQDKIYLKEAKKYILDDPIKYFKLFLKRIYSFYFLDLNSTYENYYNLIHTLPNLLLSILSILGLIVCKKKNLSLNYLILIMFVILFIYSFFAILPRYKIYIIPFQIILSLSFLDFLLKKLIKKN